MIWWKIYFLFSQGFHSNHSSNLTDTEQLNIFATNVDKCFLHWLNLKPIWNWNTLTKLLLVNCVVRYSVLDSTWASTRKKSITKCHVPFVAKCLAPNTRWRSICLLFIPRIIWNHMFAMSVTKVRKIIS